MSKSFKYEIKSQSFNEYKLYEISTKDFGNWLVHHFLKEDIDGCAIKIEPRESSPPNLEIQVTLSGAYNWGDRTKEAYPQNNHYRVEFDIIDKVSYNIILEFSILPSQAQLKDSAIFYLSNVFDSNRFTDTILKTSDGKEIKAAKFMLSRSPVFDAMLNAHDTKEAQEGVIEISDIDHVVLKEMIRFMYTDEIPKLKDMALELMIAANKYNLLKLFVTCKNYIKANIEIKTLTEVLTFADNLNIKDLKDAVMEFIFENDEAVFASDEWKSLKEANSPLAVKVLEHCNQTYKKRSEMLIKRHST